MKILNIDNVFCMEIEDCRATIFESVDELSEILKIPKKLVEENIKENEIATILGRGVSVLTSKSKNKNVVCYNIKTMMMGVYSK